MRTTACVRSLYEQRTPQTPPAALSQQLVELKDDIQSVLDEEEEAFNNLPEGLQSGERGDTMQTDIASLDAAICTLEEPVIS